MKTKFSEILKIQKQRIKEIEDRIYLCNLKISQKDSEIEEKLISLKKMAPPTSGSFGLIVAFSEMKSVHKRDIMTARAAKNALIKELNSLKNALKSANLELEKINYLHDAEVKKMLETRKKQESVALDEISVMLHANKKADTNV